MKNVTLNEIYEIADIVCTKNEYDDYHALMDKIDAWNDQHDDHEQIEFAETEDGFLLNDDTFYYLVSNEWYWGECIYKRGDQYAVQNLDGAYTYYLDLHEAKERIEKENQIWKDLYLPQYGSVNS